MTDAPGEGTPVWRTNLRVLMAAQLLAVSAMAIVIPFIPFFVRELGVVERTAVERWSGVVFSGPFLMAGLLAPVWGFLGDRFGHRAMVIRAISGLALVNFALAFVRTPMEFWVLRLVQGAVSGFIPAALAITSAGTPSRHLPQALGTLQAAASAGRLIGPAVGGVLAAVLAFRSIFLLVAGLTAAAAVMIVLWLKEPPRAETATRGTARAGVRHILGDGRTLAALALLLLLMTGASMTMPVFPLFVEDLFGTDGATLLTGIGFAAVALATLLTAVRLGWLSARFGLRGVLAGSLGVTTVALVAHPHVAGMGTMLAVRALLGVGVAGIVPTLHSIVGRRTPEGMRGAVMGFASSATIFGFFLGPLAGGWLAGHVGVDGVFRVAAGLTFAGLVCVLLIRRGGGSRRVIRLPVPTPR